MNVKSFIQKATEKIPNVKVLSKEADLTVNVAQTLKAQVIIRSVRNTQDLEFEQKYCGYEQRAGTKDRDFDLIDRSQVCLFIIDFGQRSCTL